MAVSGTWSFVFWPLLGRRDGKEEEQMPFSFHTIFPIYLHAFQSEKKGFDSIKYIVNIFTSMYYLTIKKRWHHLLSNGGNLFILLCIILHLRTHQLVALTLSLSRSWKPKQFCLTVKISPSLSNDKVLCTDKERAVFHTTFRGKRSVSIWRSSVRDMKNDRAHNSWLKWNELEL